MNVTKSKQKIDALAMAIDSLEVLIIEHNEKVLLPVFHSLKKKKSKEIEQFVQSSSDSNNFHLIFNQL